MQIVKKILLSLLGIIIILLITALFVKKEYAVEREVTINRPVSDVFNYIKFLQNQKNFSIWAQKDPHAEMEYKGVDATVGFISSWNSKIKDVGVGEQEIRGVVPNQRIDYELRFKKPQECVGQAYMTTDSVSASQTNVKWCFKGKMNYPMNLMLLMMNMDKMLGGDLQTGLDNLKTLLEK